MRRALVLVLVASGVSAETRAEPHAKPATAKPARASTPCFPAQKKPLVALEIHKKLASHVTSLHDSKDESVKAVAYGTCKLTGNELREADGSLVGELGCGMRVVRRGIADGLGIQVGAHGRDVIARKPKPLPALTCTSNGEDQAICRFATGAHSATSVDAHPDAYVVRGGLDDVVTGADALAFFGQREIAEILVSFWCH
jgi:hypothetical protein